MSEWLVALDFGTTATAVAVGGGRGRAVVLGDGSSTVPSSVFAESDGRLVVGVEADNEAELRLDAYEPTPKRRVGDGQIRLGERDFSVAEVIGAVLAPVLGEAMQQNNNTTPTRVVLTHPVAWRSRRRTVLAEALSAAGARLGVRFPEPVFVAEPVAAAQWYAHTDAPVPGEFFAVYDLGGGTFDTTVLKATTDGFDVIASGGVDPLGGFDFDAALFDYLGTKYIAPADGGLWAGLSLPGQPDPELARQRRRLQQRVGLLKTGLSTAPDKQIQLPGVTGAVVVTRSEYEALISSQIDQTIGELEDTIADAGLTPEKLTAIYRIGGAARTPLVGAALDRLQVPVKVLDQPKLVVAQGAATPQATTTAPPAAAAPAQPTPETPVDPAIHAQTPTTTRPLARSEADQPIPREPLSAHEVQKRRTDADGHEPSPKLGGRFFEVRLALRTIAIILLFFELLFTTGAYRALRLLLAGASESTLSLGVIAAVIGATVHTARKYGRGAAIAVFVGGVVGLIGSLVNFGLSRQGGDIAGYVCVLLIFLTRPPRRPTAADAARHGTAGLFIITTTLVMSAEYARARDFSFADGFSRFESYDLWLPVAAGVSLTAAGAYYLAKHVITQPEIYPRPTLQRGAALAAIVGVLIPLACIAGVVGVHPGMVYAKRISAPPFDGTYTKSYGIATKFDGTPLETSAQADNSVIARSMCNANGCVAVDLSTGTSEVPIVWDFIDGHWSTVTEYEDDPGCGNAKSTLYHITSLTPQADGSLAGDVIEEWTAGCYIKTKVTYRRTGDQDRNDALPDPSTLAARNTPPAAIGFRGQYRFALAVSATSGPPSARDVKFTTACVRSGERCLSYGESADGSNNSLIYQSGSFTGTATNDNPCPDGSPTQTTNTYTVPLPTDSRDPIQALKGTSNTTSTSGCFASGPGTVTIDRIGD